MDYHFEIYWQDGKSEHSEEYGPEDFDYALVDFNDRIKSEPYVELAICWGKHHRSVMLQKTECIRCAKDKRDDCGECGGKGWFASGGQKW